MFFVKQHNEFDPQKNKVYMPYTKNIAGYSEMEAQNLLVRINGKKNIFLLFCLYVVILLATTDIVFALDQYPLYLQSHKQNG